MRTHSGLHASHDLSACTRVDIDAINYATKYRTKIKAKFSCDQINFNEPVLKPGTPVQEQHIAKQEMLTSST